MQDAHFPLIEYAPEDSPRLRGRKHGEAFRAPIAELANIRRHLMLERNPSLAPHVAALAIDQMRASRPFDLALSEELEGIAEGAKLSLEDIVVLNNYTDFRDIELPDEGCSCVCFHRDDLAFSGQTWDMHQSAKNYLCLIRCPLEADSGEGEALVLSLVGCLGLMGVTTRGTLVGVNNLNTKSSGAGVIWPLLVRRLLRENNVANMGQILRKAPVTSGHNYMIADNERGEHWEILPNLARRVNHQARGIVFHTNHCLDADAKGMERASALSASTHPRYGLLEGQVETLESSAELVALLKSHRGYPHSLCVHPDRPGDHISATCGGGVFEHVKGSFHTWRGCSREDANYRSMDFQVEGERFVRVEG